MREPAFPRNNFHHTPITRNSHRGRTLLIGSLQSRADYITFSVVSICFPESLCCIVLGSGNLVGFPTPSQSS